MPVEIEAKMKIDDPKASLVRLKQKARSLGRISGTQHLLRHADQKLLSANKGLRIRTNTDLQTHQSTHIITFKGPQKSGQVKQREEIETEVTDLQAAISLLEQLGFIRNTLIREATQSWKLADCKIELDEVPILGSFVEIEGPSEKSVLHMRDALGLSNQALERSSYIALLADHSQKRPARRAKIFGFSGVAPATIRRCAPATRIDRLCG